MKNFVENLNTSFDLFNSLFDEKNKSLINSLADMELSKIKDVIKNSADELAKYKGKAKETIKTVTDAFNSSLNNDGNEFVVSINYDRNTQIIKINISGNDLDVKVENEDGRFIETRQITIPTVFDATVYDKSYVNNVMTLTFHRKQDKM